MGVMKVGCVALALIADGFWVGRCRLGSLIRNLGSEQNVECVCIHPAEM